MDLGEFLHQGMIYLQNDKRGFYYDESFWQELIYISQRSNRIVTGKRSWLIN